MKSKKIILFLLFLILFILIIMTVFVKKNNKNLLTYSLNKKQYKLLIADTPAKWEKGLVFFRKLDRGVDGMIFLFPDEQLRAFWNKNTFLDLRIYWMRDKKIVGEDMLPSIKRSEEVVIVHSPEKVDTVIELIQ